MVSSTKNSDHDGFTRSKFVCSSIWDSDAGEQSILQRPTVTHFLLSSIKNVSEFGVEFEDFFHIDDSQLVVNCAQTIGHIGNLLVIE